MHVTCAWTLCVEGPCIKGSLIVQWLNCLSFDTKLAGAITIPKNASKPHTWYNATCLTYVAVGNIFNVFIYSCESKMFDVAKRHSSSFIMSADAWIRLTNIFTSKSLGCYMLQNLRSDTWQYFEVMRRLSRWTHFHSWHSVIKSSMQRSPCAITQEGKPQMKYAIWQNMNNVDKLSDL